MQKHLKLTNLFFFVAGLGTLFVLVETVLQLFGRSICSAEGCRLVASSARFGDLSILLIGLSVLSLLTILAVLRKYHTGSGIESAIDLVLVVSLAAEGFFAGYQAFRLHAACIFCLVVLTVLVLLGLIRLAQGYRGVTAGFASLLAVFSMFYLVLPAGSVQSLPPEGSLVLFYSDECKFCAEVMTEIERKQLDVDHVPVGKYAPLLKAIGIEHVPTLYVKKNNERIFLTGKDSILTYLDCKPEQGSQAPARTKEPKKKEDRTERPGPLDLGGQKGLSFDFDAVLPADDGICKSEQKCE